MFSERTKLLIKKQLAYCPLIYRLLLPVRGRAVQWLRPQPLGLGCQDLNTDRSFSLSVLLYLHL